MSQDLSRLLYERDKTHGSFIVNSGVSQTIKKLLRGTLTASELNESRKMFIEGYEKMHPIHHEALDHICGKLGRIYAGQAEFDDHWDDISGYGKLPVKFNHGKPQDTPIKNSDQQTGDGSTRGTELPGSFTDEVGGT